MTGGREGGRWREVTRLERQCNAHVFLAHPDDAHVGPDDEAGVVGHVACARPAGLVSRQ